MKINLEQKIIIIIEITFLLIVGIYINFFYREIGCNQVIDTNVNIYGDCN